MPGRNAGAELHGHDFHDADLRGVDFQGADLRGANFARARTGLTRPWQVALLTAALVVSLAIGVFAGFAGRLIERLLDSGDARQQVVALTVIATLILFVVVAAWKGMERAVLTVLPITAGLFLLVGIFAVALDLGSGRGALGAAAFLLFATAMIGLGALARAVAGTVAQWAFMLVAVLGAVAGGLLGGGLVSAIIALAALLVGQSALRGRAGYPFLAHTVAEIACARGTRFSGADLRGARFDEATLNDADFRGALLEGARFADARIRLCLFDDGKRLPPERTENAANLEAFTSTHDAAERRELR